MNILLIADPHLPVPPLHYGGAERVIHLYGAELQRLGHTVHLLAGPGSQSYGGKLYIHHPPRLAYISRARRKLQFQVQSLWAARSCDIVFNQGRFDYLESLLRIGKPILHRFPNPVDQPQIDFAESRIRSNVLFQFISENQRSHATIRTPSVVIPNPIDTTRYVAGDGNGGYLVFLGRITYNKGVDIAIRVALETGKRLIIAGNIPNEEGADKYFQESVDPFLDGEQIRWIGPVDDIQKQDLLRGAAALLFPIRWDEPFGIVMVEALACGTPVLATRRASTPEVIQHGYNGFLCSNQLPEVEDFALAVRRLATLRRADCRRSVEDRYDVRILTSCLLQAMESLLER